MAALRHLTILLLLAPVASFLSPTLLLSRIVVLCGLLDGAAPAAPPSATGAGRGQGALPPHGVWVQHKSWEEEWERAMGHDMRRLRNAGVTNFTAPHRRLSPAPEDGEIVVPGNTFGTPIDAIRGAADAARLFIQGGRYCWDEGADDPGAVASVISQLHVRGKEDAMLWGRWSLQPTSCGAVRDVTLALDCRAPTTSSTAVCVLIAGGPWEFRETQLRCAGGTSVRTAQQGDARCVCSTIGGVDESWGEAAQHGVLVGDNSQALIQLCCLAASHVSAAAATGAGRLVAVGSSFRANTIHCSIAQSARVALSGCELYDSSGALFVAHAAAEDGSRGGHLRVEGCLLQGTPLWRSTHRPADFVDSGNVHLNDMSESAREEWRSKRLGRGGWGEETLADFSTPPPIPTAHYH